MTNKAKQEAIEAFIKWYSDDYIPNEFPRQKQKYDEFNDEIKDYGFHLFKFNKYINAYYVYKKLHPDAKLNETTSISKLRVAVQGTNDE